MILLIALLALVCLPALADAACPSFPGDAGCVYEATFDSSTQWPPSGWSATPTAAALGAIVSPGLNGSAHKTKLVIPSWDGSAWIDTNPGEIQLLNGQSFWIEFWIEWDSNYRWNPGCGAQCGIYPNCTCALDYSFKTFELQVHGPDPLLAYRSIFIPEGNHDGQGLNADPRWYFINMDPPTNPGTCGHFFFCGNAGNSLTTGVHHFIVKITSGYKANPFDSSVGAFKMWDNGVLTHNFTNVGTCPATSGTCVYNVLRFGGQGEGVGAGGNIWYTDQVRITFTDISPGGPTNLNPPSNLLICRGGGCTPASIPVIGGIGFLIWLRRRRK